MKYNNHEEKSFRPIIGIDLGTTNSAVAYIRGGKPQIVPSPNGEKIIPSVVLIDLEDKVVDRRSTRLNSSHL